MFRWLSRRSLPPCALSGCEMDPGRMDQRVKIQRLIEADDGGGGRISTWQDIAEVWAGVKVKSGQEGISEGRVSASATTIFTVRAIRDLTEVDRIVFCGVGYNIRSVGRISARAPYMTVEAERGVAQQ